MRDLKQNKEAYCLCTKKEREAFIKAGKNNCQHLNSIGTWGSTDKGIFIDNHTYRIKPDYKPEIVKQHIYADDDDENMYFKRLDTCMRGLEMAIRQTNFAGFEWEDGYISYLSPWREDGTHAKYVRLRK